MCFGRHKKGVFVRIGKLRGDDGIRHAPGLQIAAELLAFLIEEVGEPLQEQHAEDVFLVLRGVHIAAQIVAGAEQQAGKLAEGELGHAVIPSECCSQTKPDLLIPNLTVNSSLRI